ncbi:hypothetical protein DFH06DRAFT_1482828 [Mycena polygramma]|nr:hypothetical protein DFH06DRAFT_1482828 [Mycena polygramma]
MPCHVWSIPDGILLIGPLLFPGRDCYAVAFSHDDEECNPSHVHAGEQRLRIGMTLRDSVTGKLQAETLKIEATVNGKELHHVKMQYSADDKYLKVWYSADQILDDLTRRAALRVRVSHRTCIVTLIADRRIISRARSNTTQQKSLLAGVNASNVQVDMTPPCWNCGAVAEQPTQKAPHDLPRLQKGNDVPLDSEIPFVRENISYDEDCLDALETQIHDLEATLADLVQRRNETREHLREHRAILHPVRRAPAELICEIFVLTLDSPDGSTINELGYTPPWYLGQICRSWRRWAVAYPRLWTHITIPSSPTPSGDRSTFETLLLRSANTSLNVYWTNGIDRLRIEPQLANMAVAHCSRWGTLRLDIWGDARDALDWLLPVKGFLPSLTRLELHGGDTIPDFCPVAPSLRQVLLTDWNLSSLSPSVQIPWSQITHYRGEYREALQLDILRGAPKLVQCSISYRGRSADPLTPVELPQLQRLYIRKPRFLDHLKAPSLKELYCTYIHQDDIPVLLSFVRRSDYLLQKLVLTSCYSSLDFIALLRALPSLTYLLLQPDSSAEEQIDLFRELEITGTSPALCPNLISFIYDVCEGFPHDQFFTMARKG